MPTLFAPTAPVGKINKIVPISEGGTGGASVAEALANLGAIDASKVNQPGGPMGLDNDGKLTIDTSAISLSSGPAVNGPLSVEVGSVTNYLITNFHAATIYSVTAIGGSVVQNGETIIYTAPGSPGSSGFVVNGKSYAIDITQRSPQTPSITTPINGATNIGSTVVATSSAFTMSNGSDTHAASDWQISTSPTFATILYQSLNDTVNKTSWTSGVLTASTQYYIRVRHKGTTYGYSQWSSVVSVTTKSSFLPTGEKQKITASDAVGNDWFGWSVSLSADGSTALVGADGKSIGAGTAYIFTKSGSTWTQQQKITASDAATGDRFGYSVSLSGDGSTALVGAYRKSSDTGAAYIFTKSGSIWTQQQKITVSDAAANDWFGYSVSLSSDGSTALVGAYYKSTTGAAYIFTRSGSTWTQQAKIGASDATASDYFGVSVSLSGDGSTALVGAQGKSSNAGAAYIFTRSGSTWSQQQKLTASDAAANDSFGASVSLSSDGSSALVGAYGKSSVYSNAGAAYIFTRSGSTWSQQQKITVSDAAANDLFGASVSLSTDGSTALVGAYYKSTTGAAYIFTRSGSIWTQQAKLTASDAATGDSFGVSVSLSGDGSTALVGAYQEDPSGITNAGSAYFYA